MKKQIICINWGPKYGALYINRLHAMVTRNITPPFTFTCFTDSDKDVNPEIRCLPLPELGCEAPVNSSGIWQKSRLWNKNLGDLEGPVLFIDLDVVISGNLDGFFEFGNPDDVVLARNPTVPLERLGQTSVYRFPVGKLVPLKEKFVRDPQGIADSYVFEQRFVTRKAPGGIRFWPRPWVLHFRRQCVRIFPLNLIFEPRLRAGSKIVIFAGHLKPEDAIEGRIASQYEHLPLFAHIRRAFSGGLMMTMPQQIRRYIHPTGWVRDLWR